MGEREQIINFLLQAADAKNKQIQDLQQQLTALQKQLAGVVSADVPAVDPNATPASA